MNKSLVNSITSDYFTAANRLKPKKAKRRIVVYVESYDDIFFWRSLLSLYEDSTCYYEIFLPTQNGKIGRGKKCVLNMMHNGSLGDDMIACVDSDYDYLAQGHTTNSRKMLDTPYVYHTHTYAIENLQCWAPSLHQVAVMVTLNDSYIFDFQEYLRQYSNIVYPLFVWSVWLYRQDNNKTMSLTEMDHVITPGYFCLNRPEKSLSQYTSPLF